LIPLTVLVQFAFANLCAYSAAFAVILFVLTAMNAKRAQRKTGHIQGTTPARPGLLTCHYLRRSRNIAFV
jgi:hypothetical protein